MRTAVKIVANLVVVVVLGLVVAGWYYSTQLLPAVSDAPAVRTIEVVRADDTTLTLHPVDAPDDAVDDLLGDLVVGLDTVTGYIRLSGPPVNVDPEPAVDEEGEQEPAPVPDDLEVEREAELVDGLWPTTGDRGSMDVYAWPEDPTVTDLEVEEVTAPGRLGGLPGWVFPGTGEAADDWVVYVHGRGGSRGTALRTAPTVVEQLGRSVLSITYRNDTDAPASPDGFGHYGDTEWRDLQAWLDWLREERDVETVTFYGFSQGGSVVASCLRRCTGTEVVTNAVLDSPLLSMQATLELQAAERGIPGPFIGPLLFATKQVSGVRGGPDFDNLEHVDALATMDLPILAFVGDDDRSVPSEPTQQLGERDPDQVRVVTYEGGHVRGWNVDPATYERELTGFLGRPGSPSDPSGTPDASEPSDGPSPAPTAAG